MRPDARQLCLPFAWVSAEVTSPRGQSDRKGDSGSTLNCPAITRSGRAGCRLAGMTIQMPRERLRELEQTYRMALDTTDAIRTDEEIDLAQPALRAEYFEAEEQIDSLR